MGECDVTGSDETIQILRGFPIREQSFTVYFTEDGGRFRRPRLLEQKARQCELAFRIVRSSCPYGVDILPRLAPNQLQGLMQIRDVP